MKYIALILSIVAGIMTLLCACSVIFLFWGINEGMEIPIAIEGTMDYFDAESTLWGQNIGGPLFSLLFFILFSVCYSWYRRALKKKRSSKKENIKPPFCLYLRSFVDDAKTGKNIGVQTEEEALVEVLTDIAPVYAIGDPRDKKMPLGASRIYVDDDQWKSVVLDMAQKASVVVLRLGKTDSFWWEVEMAMKNVSLEKLLFIVPESKTFNNIATLYKILLEYNIDIKELNINISQKHRGSISSFVFFDKNGNARTEDVKIPRFSRFVLSYENILRNALYDFREKFGLKVNRKHTLRYAQLIQLVIILSLFVFCFSKAFTDYVDLKYQMPYELVEECIKDQAFVEKYSDEINGKNLCYSLIEARKGTFMLDDDMYVYLSLIENIVIQKMDIDEFNNLGENPKNMLLMVKKYCSEYYADYITLLSQAAYYSLNFPDDTIEIIHSYQNNIEYLPSWVYDFYAKSESMNNYEIMCVYQQLFDEHINDDGFADILKTISSSNISI